MYRKTLRIILLEYSCLDLDLAYSIVKLVYSSLNLMLMLLHGKFAMFFSTWGFV
jgi:hypothetical protein